MNFYLVSIQNTGQKIQKGRDNLGDLSIGGKIILKLILKNGGVKYGLDSSDSS